MDEEVKNAVFGNVGTLISFRVGVTDAPTSNGSFSPFLRIGPYQYREVSFIHESHSYATKPVPPFPVDMTRDMSKLKVWQMRKLPKPSSNFPALNMAAERAR